MSEVVLCGLVSRVMVREWSVCRVINGWIRE